MKVCKYCGTANENDAKKCASCGAVDFKNKCDRCGTVYDSAFCPNCGASLGADAENAQPTVVEHHIVIDNQTAAEPPKKKKHIFWIVVLWIIALPIMAIIAIWKSKKLPKVWKIILTCIIAAITILCFVSSQSSKDSGAAETAAEPVTAAVESAETAEPEVVLQTAKPTGVPKAESTLDASVTVGERNALNKAGDYLAYTAFSYQGLIDQLEYEGYTTEEATYAADHCGADWYKQARASAKSYLAYSAFSHDGLIDQLEFEGYTEDEATQAVEKCGADWKEQAVKKAKEYLDYSTFSRSELINQLIYEGFTQEQAEYGVSENGL